MSMFRRWVLLVLVALALPLQAVAAAAMLHCQPEDGGAMHAHAAAVAADGSHADGHVHLAVPDGDAGPDAFDAPAVAGAHACSACAVCCTLAGAPAVRLGVPAPEHLSAARPDGTSPAAIFLTSGVERPPRARG